MPSPAPNATFPLTPLQQGMLFEHLSGGPPGVDVEQIVVDLDEEVDAARLEKALVMTVARHEALRSAFRWEELESPLQDVHTSVAVPFTVEALGSAEASFESWLRRDRERGFDLATPPLLRACLLRPGRSRASLVLTFHHLLMDGRSFPIVLGELFAIYDAAGGAKGLELPTARSFREHAQHLAGLDPHADEGFWKKALEGVQGGTAPAFRAGEGEDGRPEEESGEHDRRLRRETTDALRRLAEEAGTSLATVVQGAWALCLARTSGEVDVVFGCVRAGRRSSVPNADEIVGVFINTLPLRAQVESSARLRDWLGRLRESQREIGRHEQASLASIQRWCGLPAGAQLFHSILVYDHRILDTQVNGGAEGDPELAARARRRFELFERTPYPLTLYAYGEPELRLKIAWDGKAVSRADALRLAGYLEALLGEFAGGSDRTLGEIPMVFGPERELLLETFNRTGKAYRAGATIPDLFEEQVARSPDARAVVCGDESWTYRELDARANDLARALQALGVGPEVLVALCLERSLDLAAAVLGVLKAGGAYVPLDPAYPRERLAFQIADAKARVLLTQRRLAGLVPPGDARVLFVDDLAGATSGSVSRSSAPARKIGSKSLAYVLHTSGSTGKPKGVMVEHQSVVNFFAGMDERLRAGPGERAGTWLAVTSLAFDISVLELLWTLARGFEVVLYTGRDRAAPSAPPSPGPAGPSQRTLGFSLFYFASEEGENPSEKYRLLLEGARFADERGFEAVWTPERHFHAFGGLYPNPAVASAAIATITRRVAIRAGSVVLPLHEPLRIAEEWALVDNLSNGRVGISFASGWQPVDFVLAPENYADRKEILARGIETVRSLWRGEPVTRRAPDGSEQHVRTLPRPIQPELPVWVTTAGNVETWRAAGELGANVLTHLLGQSVEELAGKIAVYREARARNGHAGPGRVTLMLHTFVGKDEQEVRALVREPMIGYLKSSVGLIRGFASSFPTFRNRAGAGLEEDDLARLSEAEMAALLEHSFQRYYETSGLFGTPRRCLETVEKIRAVGVDEVACLIDFGVPSDVVLRHLEDLDELRRLAERASEGDASSATDLLRRHRVTHMQCTPSMASLLLAEEGAEEALRGLETLLVGGEALPGPLAERLASLAGRVINMYGPTETTVWSATHEVEPNGTMPATIPLGRPIANTRFLVLGPGGELVPVGVPGELHIGGDGVARGYFDRPELTAERFVADSFTGSGAGSGAARLYRTGDIARARADGVFEYLGRSDRQVKLRGHRIELGEIDACLRSDPSVRDAVTVAREDRPGEKVLVAYVVARDGRPLDAREVRSRLLERLPEYMVPSHVVTLAALPLTPNAKIDPKALPAPEGSGTAKRADVVPPENDLERQIAAIWIEVLAVPEVGRDDNFFELGGHSLLTIQVQSRLRRATGRHVPITELFRCPTLRTLAALLSGAATDEPMRERSEERVRARAEGRDRAAELRERRARSRGQGG